MSADNLRESYTELNNSLFLPTEVVDKNAKLLIEAPENVSLTKKMRLESIAAHPNYSREIYELILSSFGPELLTSDDINILHLLISNKNATREDITTLQTYAVTSGNAEWFSSVVMKTIELNEYQLGLSYNGVSVFHDRDLREQMLRTIALLKEFQQ